MIRLTHLSGSLRGTSSTSPKAVIRIGRAADCDVRFDARLDSRVSTHHAEIRFDAGHYQVVDTGSSNGTMVNGKLVRQQKLRSGDRIVFGGQGGPEVKFEIDDAAMLQRRPPPAVHNGALPLRPEEFQRAAEPPPAPDASALAKEAQVKIAQARAMSGSQSSGQTMFIMADTMKRVEAVTERRTKKKTGRIVAIIVLISLAGFGAMGFVIWRQKQEIEQIVHKKDGLDKQIQKIQLAMQIESDPEKLTSLEEQLTLLTGKAQETIGELQKKDKEEAQKLEQSGDELDREIRHLLAKFNAQTYAVPPIFKDRLRHHVEATLHRSNTKLVYARKQKYWPIIIKEFSALGLPEE